MPGYLGSRKLEFLCMMHTPLKTNIIRTHQVDWGQQILEFEKDAERIGADKGPPDFVYLEYPRMAELLLTNSERDDMIIRYHKIFPELNQAKIGEMVGLTKQRIQQILGEEKTSDLSSLGNASPVAGEGSNVSPATLIKAATPVTQIFGI